MPLKTLESYNLVIQPYYGKERVKTTRSGQTLLATAQTKPLKNTAPSLYSKFGMSNLSISDSIKGAFL